jgi:hypothetical protein
LYVTLGVLIVYFSAKTIALHMTKRGRTKTLSHWGVVDANKLHQNSAELAAENLVSPDDHNIPQILSTTLFITALLADHRRVKLTIRRNSEQK